jgi:thiamine pyrophosphokinase
VVDANEDQMKVKYVIKKQQRKRLPRKKFDTDTELCRKNVRVQSPFTFSVIYTCALRAIHAQAF